MRRIAAFVRQTALELRSLTHDFTRRLDHDAPPAFRHDGPPTSRPSPGMNGPRRGSRQSPRSRRGGDARVAELELAARTASARAAAELSAKDEALQQALRRAADADRLRADAERARHDAASALSSARADLRRYGRDGGAPERGGLGAALDRVKAELLPIVPAMVPTISSIASEVQLRGPKVLQRAWTSLCRAVASVEDPPGEQRVADGAWRISSDHVISRIAPELRPQLAQGLRELAVCHDTPSLFRCDGARALYDDIALNARWLPQLAALAARSETRGEGGRRFRSVSPKAVARVAVHRSHSRGNQLSYAPGHSSPTRRPHGSAACRSASQQAWGGGREGWSPHGSAALRTRTPSPQQHMNQRRNPTPPGRVAAKQNNGGVRTASRSPAAATLRSSPLHSRPGVPILLHSHRDTGHSVAVGGRSVSRDAPLSSRRPPLHAAAAGNMKGTGTHRSDRDSQREGGTSSRSQASSGGGYLSAFSSLQRDTYDRLHSNPPPAAPYSIGSGRNRSSPPGAERDSDPYVGGGPAGAPHAHIPVSIAELRAGTRQRYDRTGSARDRGGYSSSPSPSPAGPPRAMQSPRSAMASRLLQQH